MRAMCGLAFLAMASATLPSPTPACAETAPTDARHAADLKVSAALNVILALSRPHQAGLATVWDGNKFVQCRRLTTNALRCESAGARLQPSLKRALTPERMARLAALGWEKDEAFGGYVRLFPPSDPVAQVADALVTTLVDGYGADPATMDVGTDWVADVPCPTRNGPRQNLAGMMSESPAMAATAIHGCRYQAPAGSEAPPLPSLDTLVARDGPRVTAELMRLSVNRDRRVFAIVGTPVGYIQCQPDAGSKTLYCEAASADSDPVLAGVLTPERVARLHAAGFKDPGRTPNFERTTALDTMDASATAREILDILFNVYGYTGTPPITIDTEAGRD